MSAAPTAPAVPTAAVDGDLRLPALEPQPPASTSGSSSASSSTACNGTSAGRRYLCYFRHRLLDFRLEEVTSLAELAGCSRADVQWEAPFGGDPMSPFWYVTLPSEDVARRIAQRSLLIKGFFEVWGEGVTWQELQASFMDHIHTATPHLAADSTFKVYFHGFGAKPTQAKVTAAMEQLAFVPFQGRAQMDNPDHMIWCIWCNLGSRTGMPGSAPPRIYLARQVVLADTAFLNDFLLTKRTYIGPTSMDAEMAFIMCNQAHARKGQLVLDPYAGTGSILVAAARCGALTMGGDIDIRVIKLGRPGKDGQVNDLYSNYLQYGLQWPAGLLRMDAHRPPFRPGLEEVFDAIVGDPPYGVRAGARKTVHKDVEVRQPETHIASTEAYTLTECLTDLLDLAARLLRIGGRLVYFLPSTPDTYCEEDVPTHPALQLVANTEQPLAARYSRRLITMTKSCAYDAAAADAHRLATMTKVMAIDKLHSMLRSPADGATEALTNNKKWRSKLT